MGPTTLLLGTVVSERRGTDPAAELLGDDVSCGRGKVFDRARAVQSMRLPRLRRPEFDRKVVPNACDADRAISSDVDRRQSQRPRWLTAFVYYYNFQRPNQALNNRTPAEEVQNR
ncbi:Integrase catalytic region [Natrinema altunense JCM 12890]|uniref:Integrase catalytic region n=1 Tax=Natrinema altunense (strain JCM 12890 / CGMCC 1.3731 / AJ2) TaxID=1227494 RepID=L9ZAV3_NATA2|nr:Integrase catalytic region [Natrinema altunense JCM 12890]